MLSIMNEEEELEEEGLCKNDGHEVVELSMLKVLEDDEVALTRIMGFIVKGTLKLKEKIKGRGVIVLIDSGAM